MVYSNLHLDFGFPRPFFFFFFFFSFSNFFLKFLRISENECGSVVK